MAAKRAKPPSGSKPQKREAKLKSPESRRNEEAVLGDQARMILIFVMLFTVAFIAVVGLRLHKEHSELVAEVHQALGQLTAEHRAVMVLREIEGCEHEQIAEILDISIGTVRSRLHRARAEMRRLLRVYFDQPPENDS